MNFNKQINKNTIKSIDDRDAIENLRKVDLFKNPDNVKNHIEKQQLADFIKKYPHYRYPGQALPNNVIKPLDKCWGRNRIYTLGGKGC